MFHFVTCLAEAFQDTMQIAEYTFLEVHSDISTAETLSDV